MVGFHCLYWTVLSSTLSSIVIEGDGQAIIPAPLSPNNNENQKTSAKTTLNDRRRVFKQIIVKCVLQLLLIETTNDLLRNDEVYRTIPPEHLLRLMGVLDHSYQFARMFNEDKELRTGLWRVGECIESLSTMRIRLKGIP
jgi:brefeldin A-inhibited guanine nucleotide-exchange protein